MPCLYKITYLPWKDNTDNKPFLYSGSHWRDQDSYLGSVSSKEWGEFWRYETKHHPDRFQKDIVMYIDAKLISKDELRILESNWQKSEDHAGSHMYFNKSNRLGGPGGGVSIGNIPWNKGKVGVMPAPWNKGDTISQTTKEKIKIKRATQVFPPRTQEQKDKMKNKVWINNPATQKNKRVDQEHLQKWLNDGWVQNRGDFTPSNAEEITIDGVTYSSLVEAARALNTHPESMRQRIRAGKSPKPGKRGSSKPIIVDGVYYESKQKAGEMLNTTSLTYWIKTGKVTVEYP